MGLGKLTKSHNNQLGLLIYFPILSACILAVCAISISLVLSKTYNSGLFDSNSGSGSLINYVSTAGFGGFTALDPTYANGVMYVSGDKANLSNTFSILLFDPSVVPDGTTLTIFNSPASTWPTRVAIQWIGIANSGALGGNPEVTVNLGTGQGVTLMTQRRIGSHLIVQIGGGTFDPPDLTPEILQVRDWVVYKYWAPQDFCTSFNNVASGTNGAVDANPDSPCIDVGGNSGIGSSGDQGPTLNCSSWICNCSTTVNPNGTYPPPASAWCNK
jgi:hypothetical protein